MSREVTEESFLKDVENHRMKVLMDSGIYRHLRFASTGEHSWNQWFEIVTWPGRLAYSGDMGTYVFQRLEDMFEFFRGRPRDEKEQLYINLGYWSEKLEAVDRFGSEYGEKIFSPEKMRKHIEEGVKEWVDEYQGPSNGYDMDEAEIAEARAKFKEELEEAVTDEIYSYLDDGEHEARRALDGFCFQQESERFDRDKDEYQFQDTWDWDCQEYTGRFVWCCYAIAWAIQQHDKIKNATVEPECLSK